jgi:hypothetical protein
MGPERMSRSFCSSGEKIIGAADVGLSRGGAQVFLFPDRVQHTLVIGMADQKFSRLAANSDGASIFMR